MGKQYEIFQRTETPSWHIGNRVAESARWVTWSAPFRALVEDLEQKGILNRRVILKDIRGCAPYPATYSLNIADTREPAVLRLAEFAKELREHPRKGDLLLFRDMLTPPFETAQLHSVFAALRDVLVLVENDRRAALYAPVKRERNKTGFNLHADMYLTTKLWLIFNDVPDDGSGASLLLSRATLFNEVRRIQEMPPEIKKKIADLMTQPIARDSFNQLYGLLHDQSHPWYASLRCAMEKQVAQLPLKRGEGLLIDDRRWLHGRTTVSQTVGARRFHRLTFGLNECAEL